MEGSRPPIPVKISQGEVNKWVYDKGPSNNGQVDYEKYGHPVAKPGPVISSKTGKVRAANSAANRTQRAPLMPKKQSSNQMNQGGYPMQQQQMQFMDPFAQGMQ